MIDKVFLLSANAIYREGERDLYRESEKDLPVDTLSSFIELEVYRL